MSISPELTSHISRNNKTSVYVQVSISMSNCSYSNYGNAVLMTLNENPRILFHPPYMSSPTTCSVRHLHSANSYQMSFAPAADESSDIQEESVKEEILDLREVSRGVDIKYTLDRALTNIGVSLNKIVKVATNEATAMAEKLH
ncbi:Hypothetical predicted protein [Octopus vulgaris]|uniref:Uncharacterized protein n=1 Tax=Octopus vulgaris TaxID=6645 RepID=A0AA36AJS2_OCTVU|nr:Hypothetical predicted protein [Octopus vulgaris]